MNIRQIRQSAGITQKDFSTRYQIPLKTLQNWEADPDSDSVRECPPYVAYLLQRVVGEDFPYVARMAAASIDEKHLAAIREAKARISRSPLHDYVKDMLLYGSTARGEAKPKSDVDILLVLDEKAMEHRKCGEWITYLKGNISSDDFNMPEADLHVVFGDRWRESDEAYFVNVRKDGFSIWS